MVLPKATVLVSLWVNWEVPVDPLSLLINALTLGISARTLAGKSAPSTFTGPGNSSASDRIWTGAELSGSGALTAYGLRWFCCWFLAVPRPNGLAANSASETPASTIRTPSKTRGLKKAECEADFFFMGGYDVDRMWSVTRRSYRRWPELRPHM